MNIQNSSTLEYKSNIQPVKGSIIDDFNFLNKIRDPFALYDLYEKTKNIIHGYHLSPIQKSEYSKASGHCSYAAAGDYPNGTVRNQDGIETIQCKCTNFECKLFTKCRPDFQEEELSVLYENDDYIGRLISFPTIEKSDQINVVGVSTVQPLMLTPPALEAYDAERVHGNGEPLKDDSLSAVIEVSDKTEDRQIPHDNIVTERDHIKQETLENGKQADFNSFIDTSQEKVIESDINERMIINAGPGTGKTWALIEKLIYMVEVEEVNPDNILVLCFSRAAVEVIEKRLLGEAETGRIGYGWGRIDIRTFDSFATYMIAWIQENYSELLPQGYFLEAQEYDDRIRTASRIFDKKGDMLSQYQHIIIDEVQDLVGCRAEFVLKLLSILPSSCGYTLLGDACQALYDYQANNDSTIMTSEEFYNKLFEKHDVGHYYSFKKNHRQEGDLSLVSIPYRKAILIGTHNDRINAINEINKAIKTSSINLPHVEAGHLNEYIQQGTLGILTRTNGQALKISTWLKNANIRHVLQRPASSAYLGEWIFRIFKSYPNQTINEEVFIEHFLSSYPESNEEHGRKYWIALTSTQRGNHKLHYEVEDLLRGLLSDSKDKLLFAPAGSSETITVSNIHRAKGREFDSVLVIDDVLTTSQDDDIQEHKVSYVAVTRPKKQISKVNLNKQYIYIDKGSNRRCFQAGGYSKKYLSHIEVGFPGDVDMRTFASNPGVQEYISSKLRSDTRLILRKCPEGTFAFVAYKIVLEEAPDLLLGYTGRQFADGLKRAIQRILNVNLDIYYRIYPETINDVYVDVPVTCISVSAKGLQSAKRFGDVMLWSGFTISGFGHAERDCY